ncbi:MAG: DoxX-like family protein [Myxococcaceae bacterium]
MSFMPRLLLVRCAIAAVWLYEGLWCKVLGRMPEQRAIVEAVPYLGPIPPATLLRGLGVLESLLAVWVLSGWKPLWAAAVQTGLLLSMNVNGLLFARRLIHDPGGMVVKNFVFIILVWVAGALGSQ